MKSRNPPSSAHANFMSNQHQQQQYPKAPNSSHHTVRAVSHNSATRNNFNSHGGQYIQPTLPSTAIPSSKSNSSGMKSPRTKSANYVTENKNKKLTKIGLDSYISNVLSKDTSILILEGRLVKAGKSLNYSISETPETYYILNIFVIETRQKWVVYVPFTKELQDLFAIWKKVPKLQNKRLVAGWILSCTNLEFTEDVIVSANFDHSKLRERIVTELVQTINDKAIQLQSVARRFLAKKYTTRLKKSYQMGPPPASITNTSSHYSYTTSLNQYDEHSNMYPEKKLLKKKKKSSKMSSKRSSSIESLHYGSALEERSLSSVSSDDDEEYPHERSDYTPSSSSRRIKSQTKSNKKKSIKLKKKSGGGGGGGGLNYSTTGKNKFQRRLDDIIATYSGDLTTGSRTLNNNINNLWTNSIDSLDSTTKMSTTTYQNHIPNNTQPQPQPQNHPQNQLNSNSIYSKSSTQKFPSIQFDLPENKSTIEYDSDDHLSKVNIDKRNDLVMNELKSVRSEINSALAHFQLELSFLRTGLQSHLETNNTSPSRGQIQSQSQSNVEFQSSSSLSALPLPSNAANIEEKSPEKRVIEMKPPEKDGQSVIIAKYEDEMTELRNEMKNMLLKMKSLQQQVESYSTQAAVPSTSDGNLNSNPEGSKNSNGKRSSPRQEIKPIIQAPPPQQEYSDSPSNLAPKESEGWQTQISTNSQAPIYQRPSLIVKKTPVENQENVKGPTKPRHSMNAGSVSPIIKSTIESKSDTPPPPESTNTSVPIRPRHSMNAGSVIPSSKSSGPATQQNNKGPTAPVNSHPSMIPESIEDSDSPDTQLNGHLPVSLTNKTEAPPLTLNSSSITEYFEIPPNELDPTPQEQNVQRNSSNVVTPSDPAQPLTTKSKEDNSTPSRNITKERDFSFRLPQPVQKEVESFEILQKISASAANPNIDLELRKKEQLLIQEQKRSDALIVIKRSILRYVKNKRYLKSHSNNFHKNNSNTASATTLSSQSGKFHELSLLEIIKKTRDSQVLKMTLLQSYDSDRPDLAVATLTRISSVLTKIQKIDIQQFNNAIQMIFTDYQILNLLMKKYLTNFLLIYYCLNIIGMLLTLYKSEELIEALGAAGIGNCLIECVDYHSNRIESCSKGLILCCHLLIDSNTNKYRFSTIESFQHISSLLEKFMTTIDMLRRILQLVSVLSDGSSVILDVISESKIPELLMKCLSNSTNNPEIIKIICRTILFLCSNNHQKNQQYFGQERYLKYFIDCIVNSRNNSETAVKQSSMTLMGIISQNTEIMNQVSGEYIGNSMRIVFEDEECPASIVILCITLIFNFAYDDRLREEILGVGIDKVLLKLIEQEKMKPYLDKIKKCLKRLIQRKSPTNRGGGSGGGMISSSPSSRGLFQSEQQRSNSSPSPTRTPEQEYRAKQGVKSVQPTPPKLAIQSSRRSPRQPRPIPLESIDSAGETPTTTSTDIPSVPDSNHHMPLEQIQQLQSEQTQLLQQVHQEDIQLKLKTLLLKVYKSKKINTSSAMKAMVYLQTIPTTTDSTLLLNSLKLCTEFNHCELTSLTISRINTLIKEAKQKRENSDLAILLVDQPKIVVDVLFGYPSNIAIMFLGFELLTHLTFAVGACDRLAVGGIFQLMYLLLLKYPKNEKLCSYILICGIRITSKKSMAKIRGGIAQGFEILLKLIAYYSKHSSSSSSSADGPAALTSSSSSRSLSRSLSRSSSKNPNSSSSSSSSSYTILEKLLKYMINCVENVPICQDNFRSAKGHETILPLFLQSYDTNSSLVLELTCRLISHLIALNNIQNILIYGEKHSLRIYIQSLKMNYTNIKVYQEIIEMIGNIYTTPCPSTAAAAAATSASATSTTTTAVTTASSSTNIHLTSTKLRELNFGQMFIDLLTVPNGIILNHETQQEIILISLTFIEKMLKVDSILLFLTTSPPPPPSSSSSPSPKSGSGLSSSDSASSLASIGSLVETLNKYTDPSHYDQNIVELSHKLITQLRKN